MFVSNNRKAIALRYGLGLVSFVVTVLIVLVFKHYSINAGLTLFLLMLIGNAWYGGRSRSAIFPDHATFVFE